MTLALLLAACAGDAGPGGAAREPADTAGGADSADTGDGVPRGALQLAFPLPERERFSMRIGVDHDPVVHEGALGGLTCTDYVGEGFPHCYDEHDGTDYILQGGFDAMDAGSTPIVAAAPGVVVTAEDGHYDRCHGDLQTGTVSCDGHEQIANAVEVRHETGHLTRYWHMKKGSVAVAVGDVVEAGDTLGLVGSSGTSTLPHLHFELQDASGVVIDPYAGPYSQDETWWCVQEAGDGYPGGCEG